MPITSRADHLYLFKWFSHDLLMVDGLSAVYCG